MSQWQDNTRGILPGEGLLLSTQQFSCLLPEINEVQHGSRVTSKHCNGVKIER